LKSGSAVGVGGREVDLELEVGVGGREVDLELEVGGREVDVEFEVVRSTLKSSLRSGSAFDMPACARREFRNAVPSPCVRLRHGRQSPERLLGSIRVRHTNY
jgi:hypothetical protein